MNWNLKLLYDNEEDLKRDLTSSEPFLSVVRKLENLVNRLEELLNENL